MFAERSSEASRTLSLSALKRHLMRLNALLDFVGITGREGDARSERDSTACHEIQMDRLGFLKVPLHLRPMRKSHIAGQGFGLRPRFPK
jgi:hypothetical protein